ncbi:ASCH domain-containing protein [Levilactobacillus suantsaiihabitans]|uniref:ASCH domain-containing protein n=1 Tax=Levilactobacillus suantsaiihabitans TaxID=2487722 RepID=A0A4Z0JFG0_9LACO|nr:ASCH domain-containing protein [Levilactobacillus suantsaiihabitans]TGD20288.1 ASCH domain-containing protein [Levilactobacillus suantsaiihabitans]
MDVEIFWQQFKNAHPEVTTNHHDTYAFGSDADALAHLVKIGRKTATTSALELYEADEPLPYVGEYNVILDGHDQPVCITQTKVTEVVAFDQVTQEHAYHEGENDRTLTSWRQGHRDFFTAEYQAVGRTFNEQIPCLCEVFERVD